MSDYGLQDVAHPRALVEAEDRVHSHGHYDLTVAAHAFSPVERTGEIRRLLTEGDGPKTRRALQQTCRRADQRH